MSWLLTRRSAPRRTPRERVRRGWGGLVTLGRHLRTLPVSERRTEAGGAVDLPAPWPFALVDRQTKTIGDGFGPLFHREFRVRAVDAAGQAADLVELLSRDLDRVAPPHVVTFSRQHGTPGRMLVGDEYRVYMPAPWDGPVRVLARTDRSFRFGTLDGHLEAGVIEFRAEDVGPGTVDFTIEVWSRAGDRAAELVYRRLPLGREVQAALWMQCGLGAVRLLGARREGPVREITRCVPERDLDAR